VGGVGRFLPNDEQRMYRLRVPYLGQGVRVVEHLAEAHSDLVTLVLDGEALHLADNELACGRFPAEVEVVVPFALGRFETAPANELNRLVEGVGMARTAPFALFVVGSMSCWLALMPLKHAPSIVVSSRCTGPSITSVNRGKLSAKRSGDGHRLSAKMSGDRRRLSATRNVGSRRLRTESGALN
jgi:hypothetical protein